MVVEEDEVCTGQDEVVLKQMNDGRWLRSAGAACIEPCARLELSQSGPHTANRLRHPG
jgi:hypothetical protein